MRGRIDYISILSHRQNNDASFVTWTAVQPRGSRNEPRFVLRFTIINGGLKTNFQAYSKYRTKKYQDPRKSNYYVILRGRIFLIFTQSNASYGPMPMLTHAQQSATEACDCLDAWPVVGAFTCDSTAYHYCQVFVTHEVTPTLVHAVSPVVQ